MIFETVRIILILFALYYVIAGTVFSMKPDYLLKYVDFWRSSGRIYGSACAAIIVSGLMVASYRLFHWPVVICLTGTVGFIKAAFILKYGPAKIMEMLSTYRQMPAQQLRITGLMMTCFGWLLLNAI